MGLWVRIKTYHIEGSLIFVYYQLSAFYGYSKHYIVYDAEYNTWAIIDGKTNPVDFTIDPENYTVLAVLSSDGSKSHVPTGLNKWELLDSECQGVTELKLTVVNCQFFLENRFYLTAKNSH